MMQLLLTSANLVSCRALHLALFHQRNVDPQENKTFSSKFANFFQYSCKEAICPYENDCAVNVRTQFSS